tara:strand:+ start:2046 stop:2306 length:261 start_codon:yes stop_codon:yes gene_type:complete
MKSSFIFNNDEYILEVFYIYEKGMKGDWDQPDDPDELEYYKINLVGAYDEEGNETILHAEIDIQYLLSDSLLELINDEMQEDLEKH